MLGCERLRSDYGLANVPLGPLPQLDAELVPTLVKVTLNPARTEHEGTGVGAKAWPSFGQTRSYKNL